MFIRKPNTGAGAPSPRLSLLAQVSALVGGNLAASALRMVNGFFTARVVEPAVMGLFSGIGLVQGYIPFFSLGILNGLNRELPYYIGKGDHARARELASAAQAWALALGAGVALSLTGVAAWYAYYGKWTVAAGWLTNAISGFSLFYSTYYLQVTFRTRGDFARLALVNVIQSVISLLLVMIVWWLTFYGLCLRAVLVLIVQNALLWLWRPIRVGPEWNRRHLLHLFKIGAPIFAVGQLYVYWTALDGTLMLLYCGQRGLGLYAVAVMASTSLLMLPDAITQVLYPQMAEQYGRCNDLRALVRSAVRPMMLALLVVVPLTIAGWACMPWVVTALLPKYVDAIPAAQWSLLLAPVMCLHPVNNVFVVVKRQDLYAIAIVVGMAAYYGCVRWFLRDGPDITVFPRAMIAGKAFFILACYAGLAWMLRKEGKLRKSGERPHVV